MFKQVQRIKEDVESLTSDVQSLIDATAGAAEDTVLSARKRLSKLVHDGEKAYGRMQRGAVRSARHANAAVLDHPYRAMGIALGVGVALGAAMKRRSR